MHATPLGIDRVTRWLPLGVVAAGVIAYANSFSGPFIFDDTSSITTNPGIFHFWHPSQAGLHPTRYLADLSFALNYSLSGFNATDFHVTNLLIHLTAALLLYGVVQRSLALPRFGDRYRTSGPWLASGVAALWVAHPLQTESVTYIVQRIEALMGLFYLLTLYCFIRGLTSSRPRGWMDGAVAACALGMGTKEIMVTAPFMLYLYDAVLVSSSWLAPLRQRGKVHVALLLTIGIFAMLFLRLLTLADTPGSLVPSAVTPLEYARTQLGVVAHYLRLAFVPYPLCLDYRWELAESWREVMLPGLLWAVLGMATLWTVIRRHPLAFPSVAFFAVLAPTSSFLPLPDAAFEHRMYLPLAAVLAIAVVGAYTLLQSALGGRDAGRRLPVLAGIAITALVVTLVGMTRARNLDYRSDESMWRDVIRKRPDNHRAYVGLSYSLLGDDRYPEAIAVCTNMLARLPDLSGVSTNELAAMPRYLCNMYAMGHLNWGIAELNLNRLEVARGHYALALRAAPDSARAHNNLAYVLFREGHLAEAAQQWRETLTLDVRNARALCFLGLVAGRQGRFAEAAAYFRRSLTTKPDLHFARAQLAWLLATCAECSVRNGGEAVRVALPLIDASQFRSPRAYDIVAAAYAEAGDFAGAVKMAERAAELAGSPPSVIDAGSATVGEGTGKEDFQRAYSAAEIQGRLDLYRSGHPYRSPQ